jgi:hypothetical protein
MAQLVPSAAKPKWNFANVPGASLARAWVPGWLSMAASLSNV